MSLGWIFDEAFQKAIPGFKETLSTEAFLTAKTQYFIIENNI